MEDIIAEDWPHDHFVWENLLATSMGMKSHEDSPSELTRNAYVSDIVFSVQACLCNVQVYQFAIPIPSIGECLLG